MPSPDPSADQKHPLKVLCVDDNTLVCECIQVTMKRMGFHSECAFNGRTALDRMAGSDRPFDLLITDFEMPQLNGLELVHEVRKLGLTPKIIVVSGNLPPERVEAFHAAGAHIVLEKPVLPSTIIAAIQRLRKEA
jgi:CheY-like chemotaxis protein